MVLGLPITDGYLVWKWKDDSSLLGRKKIILTTDKNLIADGVQAIDDKFLQWFVKNPSCERVETFTDAMACSLENCDGKPCINYKITIPQKEPLSKLQIAKNIAAIGIGKEEPKQNSCDIIFETAALIENKIDFAKFHCEAQVKAMSDYINQCITKGIFPHDCHILNAYPLTNIK